MAINTEYQGLGNNEKSAFEHAKAAASEAKAFKEAVSSSVENFTNSIDLRGRVQRHPLGMVCAALGVGYVLGGGLFSPFTSRLLKVGIRLAIIRRAGRRDERLRAPLADAGDIGCRFIFRTATRAASASGASRAP
ncbi:MAG TPA: hypothetical protein VF993_03325 [Myxococcales bacterium]